MRRLHDSDMAGGWMRVNDIFSSEFHRVKRKLVLWSGRLFFKGHSHYRNSFQLFPKYVIKHYIIR